MMINDEIDWNQLLTFNDGVENFDFFADASPKFSPEEVNTAETTVAAAAGESWMGELEKLLMKDDDEANNNGGSETTSNSDFIKEFDLEVCDFLLASSPSIGNEGVVLNDQGIEISPNFESNSENNDKSSDDAPEVNDNDNNDVNDNDNDDPLSKKRKRQSRNREAAMRSRERKKSLVKDLEMKSRYFEEECRRLQRMLHCCYVENQWLRCSLQTYGAPITKPESAVLLLESLLLGSLVWLMVNICLFPQLKLLPLLNQEAAVLVNAVRKDLETAKPRGKGTKISEMWMSLSFTMTKKCKASRTKMKSHSTLSCFYNPILSLS